MTNSKSLRKSSVAEWLSSPQALIDLDKERCKRSLAHFVKRAWHVIEPATPYVHGWVIDAICAHLEAVTRGEINRLLLNVPPGFSKSLLVGVFWPAWEWGPIGLPDTRYMAASHEITLAIRDNRRMRLLVESPWYQERWPTKMAGDQNAKMRFENVSTGFRLARSITSLTGERAHRLIIDDPHSTETAESETERENSLRVFRESATSRLTDPKTSAIVVVMQRLHEEDLSGWIIANSTDYTHLMLPMRFESDRRCVTPYFADPRKEEGELLFPERFPLEVVERDERTMGQYACTPAESPVLMADLTLKPISEVKQGDVVVGFGDCDLTNGAKYARQTLQRSKVRNVHRYHGPVVKMTLDSGEVIRCTPDHKWFKRTRNDRNFAGRNEYGPAKVGTPLCRVCPPSLPTLLPHEERMAGWLAGFYDGEGTVSFRKREGNTKAVANIQIFQGAGRNGPLCEKLEAHLRYFGFDFAIYKDERKDPKRGVNYEYRCYHLRGKSLDLLQRFLHIVQPVKWRDRMIDGAFGTKFKGPAERVVSIEPDGEEDVFALETETGNYVVWGLASSNSAGQFQQRPTPREGGLFKVDRIEIIEALPEIDAWVRAWDLAGTEGSGARTAGVLMGRRKDGRGYVIADVRLAQKSPGGVRTLIKETAALDKAEYGSLKIRLPQDPGQAGKAQAQEFRILLDGYSVKILPVTGDKATRAEPFSVQVEASRVFMLKGDWNDAYTGELRLFPAGKYADQVDASTDAHAELQGGKNDKPAVAPLTVDRASPYVGVARGG